MAIFGALSTARSGLIATGASLSVIGNNIANVNTVGFKGSRTEFADLLSAQGGGGSAGKIGLGTRIGRVGTLFTQGNIENTGRPTDLAIEGNGFFVVASGDGDLFTRAGNFRLDANGRLVTFQGLPVQGFALNATDQAVGAPTDVAVTGASSQPIATTLVSLKSNLRADSPLIAGGFDGTSFDSAFSTSNFTTSIGIFDSLGARHTLTLFFTKTADNTWDYNAGIDAGETGGTAGDLQVLGGGSLSFNSDGSLNATTPDPATASVTFSGAAAQDVTLNFGTPNPADDPAQGLDGLTQFAGPSCGRLPDAERRRGWPAAEPRDQRVRHRHRRLRQRPDAQPVPARARELHRARRPDAARQRSLSRVGRLRLAGDRGAGIRRPRQRRRRRRRALERVDRAGVHRLDLDATELPGERPGDHLERRAAERPDQHRPLTVADVPPTRLAPVASQNPDRCAARD